MATKRGAAADAVDAIPSKRQRFQEEATVPSLLDDINDDCVLLILKYLPAEDLNSVAICSRRYRGARSHESLDRTRTGTIVCSENTNLESIRTAFVAQQWNRVFTGNRTHLKIVGLERMPALRDFDFEWPPLSHLLSNVSSLVIKPLSGNRTIQHSKNVMAFVRMVPNLDEMDLGRMIIVVQQSNEVSPSPLSSMIRASKSLRRFNWNASQKQAHMYLDGSNFTHHPNFTEYYLDECHLVTSHPDARQLFSVEEATGLPNFHLFWSCPHLERISIKNITWSCDDDERPDDVEEVSQEMLIKMVRHHPTLRWLRSDLTKENVSMLQKERPEITFGE